MKIDIIVVYVPRYRFGHEKNFVPPITGIHLAALTPPDHEVRVIHQQVQPIDYRTDADLIALSFFSGFAPQAYRIAERFRRLGKTVVAGGPHVTFSPTEALDHCDAVVVGEAESVWKTLLQDAEQNRLQRVYRGMTLPLAGLPTPRYDLLPDTFFIPRVVQATRGCYFNCSFCSVPAINPGFRMRPVDEVIADIKYDRFAHWWQRKLVWFWDDNPTANRKYFKELLCHMIPLNKWWLTQASIDIVKDRELLDLMEASGCIGIFLGIESFGEKSLGEADKGQNKVRQYKEAIEILHSRGINVMAGFIAGFDHDTRKDIADMAARMMEIGVDVPFISVLTPFKGTPLYDRLEQEGRLLTNRGWEFYNGYNVAFQPKNLSADDLKEAHTELWKRAFSFGDSFKRALRGFLRLRLGALFMSLAMNGFYGLKALRGNSPADVKQRIFQASLSRRGLEVTSAVSD